MLKRDQIKELIKNSNLSMKEIAKSCGVHVNTVYNINSGKTYHDPAEKYPLRQKDSDKVNQLREKLTVPRLDILEESSVLSPRVLDYISLLSLLDVPSTCIVLFKNIFIKDLEVLTESNWTNETLSALVKTRPSQPNSLKCLIDAYYNPSVRFLNLPYWVKINFLSEEEAQNIYLLFS